MRGPGITSGRRIASIGSSVDIMPTMMGLAGLELDPDMDGRYALILMMWDMHPRRSANSDANIRIAGRLLQSCSGVPVIFLQMIDGEQSFYWSTLVVAMLSAINTSKTLQTIHFGRFV